MCLCALGYPTQAAVVLSLSIILKETLGEPGATEEECRAGAAPN